MLCRRWICRVYVSIGGLAVERAFGSSWDAALSVLIAFALFSSLSAFIILGPRVYYAMARDGVFFKSLAKVHARHKVPVRAIILQGLIASALVLSGTFDQILTFMGFALGVFPLFAVFGLFKLRRRCKPQLRISGFPVVPAIYLTVSLVILIFAFLQRPLESGLALVTVLAGIPVFLIFRQKNPRQQK
ncbi:MAG: amino acid permease [candidate division KSB1 bacterium]|nr:amino acid permease [candidate division KSB1 bacterium]